ncbi:MAG: ABC transporter substrate binding protein [bacterium]
MYTAATRGFVERAMTRAAELEITLIPVFIKGAEEFLPAMKAISSTVDLLWLVEDPSLVTPENLIGIRDLSSEARVPVLAYSRGLVDGGLTMAITPDRSAVAGQLLQLVQRTLAGEVPASINVEAPDRTSVFLNRQAVDQLSIQLDPGVASFATLVDTQTSKKSGGR